MTPKFEKIRQNIKLRSLPNGNHQSIPVFVLTWNLPGKHVYIQSSVHGAEIQGNGVIFELMNKLSMQPFHGKITLVPYANPFSINNKMGTHTFGRFNPVTGENWNRSYANLIQEDRLQMFANKWRDQDIDFLKKEFRKEMKKELEGLQQSSYGLSDNRLMAYKLQEMALEADIVLDLHCGPVATDYVYALEGEAEKVRDLSIPFVIFARPVFGGAMDEAIFCPWYRLERLTGEKFEIESYTVELRSEEQLDFDLVKKDTERLLGYLKKRDIYLGTVEDLSCEIYGSSVVNFKTYYASESGQCHFHQKVGQVVRAGDKLYTLLALHDEADFHTFDVKALADGVVINHCPTGNVVGGMEIYQILEKIQRL